MQSSPVQIPIICPSQSKSQPYSILKIFMLVCYMCEFTVPEEGPAAEAAGRPVVEEVALVAAPADGARHRRRGWGLRGRRRSC